MTEEGQDVAKKAMTDEERAALCQKLDKELDDFIDSLEKKRYTEGWPEDRWEEEMDKHPFFMKTVPEDGALSPLAEGLANLKYDPEENTPEELAINYKEDGNFNFKHKNYRLAILGYTEGIKQRCEDAAVNASLYNNRAACHWHLKNYRSALFDSEKALTFSPDHTKARLRAAKSALEIAKYDTCIAHCQKILELQPRDEEVINLLNVGRKKKLLFDRDQRKKERKNKKEEEQRDLVIKAIKERGIRIAKIDDIDDLDLAELEPVMPGAQDARVQIEDGVLKWPVILLYPEYQITDFIRDCPENVSLNAQLEQLFPAPWDQENKYSSDRVNLYYEGCDLVVHVIDPKKTLGELLVSKYLEVKAGVPAFSVLPRGSDVERRFLESYLSPEKARSAMKRSNSQ